MSWVIKNRETGEVICELFNHENVKKLNTAKYEAVPILKHLHSLNARLTCRGLHPDGEDTRWSCICGASQKDRCPLGEES